MSTTLWISVVLAAFFIGVILGLCLGIGELVARRVDREKRQQ